MNVSNQDTQAYGGGPQASQALHICRVLHFIGPHPLQHSVPSYFYSALQTERFASMLPPVGWRCFPWLCFCASLKGGVLRQTVSLDLGFDRTHMVRPWAWGASWPRRVARAALRCTAQAPRASREVQLVDRERESRAKEPQGMQTGKQWTSSAVVVKIVVVRLELWAMEL